MNWRSGYHWLLLLARQARCGVVGEQALRIFTAGVCNGGVGNHGGGGSYLGRCASGVALRRPRSNSGRAAPAPAAVVVVAAAATRGGGGSCGCRPRRCRQTRQPASAPGPRARGLGVELAAGGLHRPAPRAKRWFPGHRRQRSGVSSGGNCAASWYCSALTPHPGLGGGSGLRAGGVAAMGALEVRFRQHRFAQASCRRLQFTPVGVAGISSVPAHGLHYALVRARCSAASSSCGVARVGGQVTGVCARPAGGNLTLGPAFGAPGSR